MLSILAERMALHACMGIPACGAVPLVCLVCLMHAELILSLSLRPQHDPWLLHAWSLVLGPCDSCSLVLGSRPLALPMHALPLVPSCTAGSLGPAP